MTDGSKALTQAADLITEMVMELHFRGCDDSHPLIRRAGELLPKLKGIVTQQHSEQGKAAPPQTLHLMSAESVSVMDLDEKLALGEVSEADLAEAAFTFENELMAVLGDDNAMPMAAYSGMDGKELIKIIRAAVDNICRLRTS